MSPAPVLPESDLARIRQFCEARSPAEFADRSRVEFTVRGRTVTIVEHELFGDDWLELMVARLKFDTGNGKWTLYWPDRNGRFHRYEEVHYVHRPPNRDAILRYLAPGALKAILAEVDRDPHGIF